MNRTIRTIAAIGLVSLFFQARLVAGPKGVKPTKPATTKPASAPVIKSTSGHGSSHSGSSIKSGKSGAPTTTSTKPATKVDVKATKTTVKTAKADAKTTKVDAKSTKTDAKSAKADAKASKYSTTSTSSGTSAGSTETSTNSGTGSTTSDSTSTSTSTTGTGTTPVVSNPLADKISRNPKLAQKVASRLPSDMTLAQASTGFRNQGQFLAAVNVSRNLGIDFVKLQTAMTGQKVTVDPTTHEIITKPTGDAPVSLGRAIQTLKPGVDADAAVQTAQAQSSTMVSTSTTTTTSSSTTSSTTTTTSSTTSSPTTTTTATTAGKTKKK